MVNGDSYLLVCGNCFGANALQFCMYKSLNEHELLFILSVFVIRYFLQIYNPDPKGQNAVYQKLQDSDSEVLLSL